MQYQPVGEGFALILMILHGVEECRVLALCECLSVGNGFELVGQVAPSLSSIGNIRMLKALQCFDLSIAPCRRCLKYFRMCQTIVIFSTG